MKEVRFSVSNGRFTMAVWQVLLGVLVLAAWQWLVSARVLDPFFFSRPTDVTIRVWQWMSTGSIWPHLVVTLEEALLSFVIGVTLGVGCGFLLARVPLLAALLDPYIRIFNALPRVVLAPIFLLWFGLGIWSKVALGVTVVFFIVFFNAYQGVREVDPRSSEQCENAGRKRTAVDPARADSERANVDLLQSCISASDWRSSP